MKRSTIQKMRAAVTVASQYDKVSLCIRSAGMLNKEIGTRTFEQREGGVRSSRARRTDQRDELKRSSEVHSFKGSAM